MNMFLIHLWIHFLKTVFFSDADDKQSLHTDCEMEMSTEEILLSDYDILPPRKRLHILFSPPHLINFNDLKLCRLITGFVKTSTLSLLYLWSVTVTEETLYDTPLSNWPANTEEHGKSPTHFLITFHCDSILLLIL